MLSEIPLDCKTEQTIYWLVDWLIGVQILILFSHTWYFSWPQNHMLQWDCSGLILKRSFNGVQLCWWWEKEEFVVNVWYCPEPHLPLTILSTPSLLYHNFPFSITIFTSFHISHNFFKFVCFLKISTDCAATARKLRCFAEFEDKQNRPFCANFWCKICAGASFNTFSKSALGGLNFRQSNH